VPRVPAMMGMTCELCSETFGTMLTEVHVRGLVIRAVCRTCADAIVRRDGKVPASLDEWNEAIKKSVPKPSGSAR
jgi:ribosome-binding protein aMBF1 (putative translation factor)